MHPEQLQKWDAVRNRGFSRFLLTRTLLWGSLLGLAAITSSIIQGILAEPLRVSIMYALFSKERLTEKSNSIADSIVNFWADYHGDMVRCFLLAGFVALAIWTYKEESYHASTTFESNQS
jgi:hypothetical protein